MANGLLGLGGLSGAFGASPPAGLLGPYFSPQDMRKQQLKQGLLAAGIGLLTGGKGSTGEVIGQGLAAGLQGANNAGINYKQDAMGYNQLDMQMKEQKEKEAKKAAIMEFVSKLSPEDQKMAEAYPEIYAQQYMESKFSQKSGEPKIVPKNSLIYENGKWISPPVNLAGTSQAIDDPLKISKNFETSPGMERISQIAPTIKSMQKSLTDPSAMADLDFVYGLAKILDPTSVVRESEGKMVIDAQGLGPSMLGQLNKLMSGEQAMLPEIRQKLFGVAVRRAKELEEQANKERGHFSNVATENQFNPDTYLQQVPKTPVWDNQNMNPPVNQVPQLGGKTSTGVPWSIVP